MAEVPVELDGREEGRGTEGGVKLFHVTRLAREIEGGMEGGNDFWSDFEKVETQMDTLPFIKQMLSKPVLRVLLSDTLPLNPDSDVEDVITQLRDELEQEDRIVEGSVIIQQLSRYCGFLVRQQINESRCRRNNRLRASVVFDNQINLDLINCGILVMFADLYINELEHKDKDPVINSLDHKADSSNCLSNEEKSRALLLMTAFPAVHEMKEPLEIFKFLIELSRELDNLPELICKACEEQHLAVFLIGRLLSVKPEPRTYDTFKRVKDDLVKIKESDNGATNNHMWHIFTYCYNDLPYSLQSCFMYLACYPINYEIQARSLIELWIGEAFIIPVKGETIEDTAYKYLEQLVQRSLVCISKRSFSGTIKYVRVLDSIHEYAIQQSCREGFLVPNPDPENMESVYRLALHSDNKTCRLLPDTNVHSVLAFNFDRIVLGPAFYLEVLELRKSVFPKFDFSAFKFLVYLGLRGSNISELPEDGLDYIQTLDVRDTRIQILPESLWKIESLRHVYVNPSSQIKGPPSTSNISDLQILKTVVVHESWIENFPQCLINLRKLALSNRDNNSDWKSNPYWESISNLLGHMVNLLSMTIIGNIVPSELVDTRAFPNLETVKSIKFEGKWSYRKLFIDNVSFPPNLTKLTLTKSGLKEDPMPRLERLQALKFLSLQDEAYTGTQMVCSANGFPQLQLLELKKFENLESLEAKPMAMPQLTQVHVAQCPKLKLNFHSRAFSSEVMESTINEETGTTGIESGLNLLRTDSDQPGSSAEYYEPGPNIDLDLH